MKVLLINGSPREGGNSDILSDCLLKGAHDGGAEIEKISLRDFNISFCRACYACFSTGHCIQKDDMEWILEKIEAADAVVLASPTYFLTMSGEMKTMIDRLLPKWQDLGGKKAAVIVTGHDGRSGLERNASDLTEILTELGCDVMAVVYGEHVWKKGEVLGTKAMDYAYKVGFSLAS